MDAPNLLQVASPIDMTGENPRLQRKPSSSIDMRRANPKFQIMPKSYDMAPPIPVPPVPPVTTPSGNAPPGSLPGTNTPWKNPLQGFQVQTDPNFAEQAAQQPQPDPYDVIGAQINAENHGNMNNAFTRDFPRLLKQYRPDLANGKSNDDIMKLRQDRDIADAMAGRYAAENAMLLKHTSAPVNVGTLNAAHIIGAPTLSSMASESKDFNLNDQGRNWPYMNEIMDGNPGLQGDSLVGFVARKQNPEMQKLLEAIPKPQQMPMAQPNPLVTPVQGEAIAPDENGMSPAYQTPMGNGGYLPPSFYRYQDFWQQIPNGLRPPLPNKSGAPQDDNGNWKL